MRILADQNIPKPVVETLRKAGHDVVWIGDTAAGIPDPEVLKLTIAQDRLLLTFDKEFAATATRNHVTGLQGIILLRLPSLGRLALADALQDLFSGRVNLIGHFAIVKRDGVRLRKLE